ncbi:MAG TPA: hypothetical protein VGM83_03875 [Devosiaceae bacterium]|jgi:hypothetical protein
MVERKPGPVKPPVIDLTARDTTAAGPSRPAETPMAPPQAHSAEPETAKADTATPGATTPEPAGAEGAKPESLKPEPTRPEPAKPAPPKAETAPPRPGSTPRLTAAAPAGNFAWPTVIAGAMAGAVLGTALTYLLLMNGLLPVGVGANGDRVAILENRLQQSDDTSRAAIATLTERLDGFENQLNARTAPTASNTGAADIATIKTDLAALAQRVDGLNPGGQSADLTALQQAIAGLRSDVDAVKQETASTDSKIADLGGTVTAAQAQLGALKANAADAANAPAAQLPLLLSTLETAFDTGRPFAVPLQRLPQVAPDVAVPADLAGRAEAGLRRPDLLAQDFSTVLPEMLHESPGTPDADWQQQTFDWLKSQLALRPSGEIAGTTPEALTSQLEAAMERRDYTEAAKLFSALPQPMRQAAEAVISDVTAHAQAEALLEALRAKALTPATTGTAQ